MITYVAIVPDNNSFRYFYFNGSKLRLNFLLKRGIETGEIELTGLYRFEESQNPELRDNITKLRLDEKITSLTEFKEALSKECGLEKIDAVKFLERCPILLEQPKYSETSENTLKTQRFKN
jgi:hypothetical protein